MLVRYGMRIRDRLRDVISIVRPETLLAWNRRMERSKWDFSDRPRKVGRPRKGAEVEEQVFRLAKENGWDCLRIVGEMAKLGHDVSKSYVHDVLIKHGLPRSRLSAMSPYPVE